MKQTEITPCVACGKGVMHRGHVTFYAVRLERLVVNLDVVHRQAGLEAMLGSPALAYHMGPRAEIATTVPGTVAAGLVCETCAIDHGLARFCEVAGKESSQ